VLKERKLVEVFMFSVSEYFLFRNFKHQLQKPSQIELEIKQQKQPLSLSYARGKKKN